MSARVAHSGPTAADIQRMIEDGRLIFDREVDGRKLYKLDRKRLGMPEYPEVEKKVEEPVKEYKEPEENQEPLEDLKVRQVKMPKTLEAALKKMKVKKFKS